MLFQMCYGPEIESIYNTVCKHPGITVTRLTELFQYKQEGNITSLVEGTVVFLKELQFVEVKGKEIYPLCKYWSTIVLLEQLNNIMQKEKNSASLNEVFSSIYYELFVKLDRMHIQDLYQEVNMRFPNQPVGHEKINAWKRLMEFFGLGYRAYGGFYALPHLTLLENVLKEQNEWEGPVQVFCQKYIHPVIPCEYEGRIYRGMIFGLQGLQKRGIVNLQYKQDLPYTHYEGEKGKWNWIQVQIKEEEVCSLA